MTPITVKRYSFLQAVQYLQPLLDQVRAHARKQRNE